MIVRLLAASLFITALLTTSGCENFKGASADDPMWDDPRDTPRGPGIFTGRSGEWKILGR